MRSPLIFLFGASLFLMVALLIPGRAPEPAAVPAPQLVVPQGSLAPAEETTIALFQQSRDSVVAITTAQTYRDPWSTRSQEVPQGSGSGFLWDERGHVVTNNHVIEGASSAKVQLADGTVLEARLIGVDRGHDLAVLQVELGPGAPRPLPLGSSADLRVGQSVLAIGNPYGLDWTLTTGIVSALGREIPTSQGGTIDGLIQTDAAINPGNSGGPLIDSSGRLIGVNTAIYSPSGSNAGIGFAVPVDTVNRVVPQLIATGRYSPPWLGVVHDERINRLARQQGLPGVLVLGLDPGSPAQMAGLTPAYRDAQGRIVPGDILTALNGEALETSDMLTHLLDRHSAGDRLVLTVLRGGQNLEIPVVLAPGAPIR